MNPNENPTDPNSQPQSAPVTPTPAPQEPQQPVEPVTSPTPQVITPQPVAGAGAPTPAPVSGVVDAPKTPVSPTPMSEPSQTSSPNPAVSSPAPAQSVGIQPQPSKRNRNLLVAIVVLIVIGTAAFAGYMVFSNSNKSHSNSEDHSSHSMDAGDAAGSDVMARSDKTLDLAKLVDKNQSIKAQDLKAKVGNQLNLSDGISYMVASVERNYASSNKYLKVDAGKELVKVNIVFGNRRIDEMASTNDYDYTLKNSKGESFRAKFIPGSDTELGAIGIQDVASGKQVTGAVYFEVGKGDTLVLLTEDVYSALGSDEEIKIATEVSL